MILKSTDVHMTQTWSQNDMHGRVKYAKMSNMPNAGTFSKMNKPYTEMNRRKPITLTELLTCG